MAADVLSAAQWTVDWSKRAFGQLLDFTPASLSKVETMLARIHADRAEVSEESRNSLIHCFSCYVLEVGRRYYGGRYDWWLERNAHVLVSGEPDAHIALMTKDKVAGRIGGDEADNIPFFFEGFAERAKTRTAGDKVLFV